MSDGFVKLQRGDTTMSLLKYPNAMQLLTVIALRARWRSDPGIDGLGFGQCLIGDHDTYGLTRKAERVARGRLKKFGLASFHGTPAGTVATLLNASVFSLRDEREGPKQGQLEGQPTSEVRPPLGAGPRASKGPARGQRGATNEAGKTERMEDIDTDKGAGAPVYPPALDTPTFRQAWTDYVAYRRESKLKPLKPRSVAGQLKEMATWGEPAAVESIRQTIRQAWQGLFPPKSQPNRYGEHQVKNDLFGSVRPVAGDL